VDIPDNDKDLYTLRYSEFVVPLVKAVQELSEKVDKQQQIIADQQHTISSQQKINLALMKRLEHLEKVINEIK
jgi:hypothetical protein